MQQNHKPQKINISVEICDIPEYLGFVRHVDVQMNETDVLSQLKKIVIDEISRLSNKKLIVSDYAEIMIADAVDPIGYSHYYKINEISRKTHIRFKMYMNFDQINLIITHSESDTTIIINRTPKMLELIELLQNINGVGIKLVMS